MFALLFSLSQYHFSRDHVHFQSLLSQKKHFTKTSEIAVEQIVDTNNRVCSLKVSQSQTH